MPSKGKEPKGVSLLRSQGAPEHMLKNQERYLLDCFDATESNPKAWQVMANSLKHAADLLWEGYSNERKLLKDAGQLKPLVNLDLWRVYMLLTGQALEVLVKAVLVQDSPQHKLTAVQKNHHILKLLKDAKIIPTQLESELIERLEGFAVWAGRYPIPKTSEDMFMPSMSSDDPITFDRLYQRITERIT